MPSFSIVFNAEFRHVKKILIKGIVAICCNASFFWSNLIGRERRGSEMTILSNKTRSHINLKSKKITFLKGPLIYNEMRIVIIR